MGTLYVVATPIGNVEDLSPRACRVLNEVDVIAAEDTRHTGRLLARFGIETPMVSYHSFNERSRVKGLLERLAESDVALVSDAGTPAISDPGATIVRAAVDAGFQVRAIPGPSALTAAMSISGFTEGPAIFLGFLPRKKGDRGRLLEKALEPGFPVYFFESPRRVAGTLSELAAFVPEREVVLFRELTKLYEEAIRGLAAELANRPALQEGVKGEIVVGVAGRDGGPASDDSCEGLLVDRLSSGMSVSQAAKEVALLTGISRSEVYERAMGIRQASRQG
jgi:16S rRNA (cytidine1402-2'-O)-methyltransferase